MCRWNLFVDTTKKIYQFRERKGNKIYRRMITCKVYLILKCSNFINLTWYKLTTWVSEKKNLGNLSSLHHRGAGDGNS